jgi:hypothetical protein
MTQRLVSAAKLRRASLVSCLAMLLPACETFRRQQPAASGLHAPSEAASGISGAERPQSRGLETSMTLDHQANRYSVQMVNTSNRALHNPFHRFRDPRAMPGGIFVVGRSGTHTLTWFSTVRGISDQPWSPYQADGVVPSTGTAEGVIEPGARVSHTWQLKTVLLAYLQNLTPDSMENCRSSGGEYRLLLALPDETNRLVLLARSEWHPIPNNCQYPL